MLPYVNASEYITSSESLSSCIIVKSIYFVLLFASWDGLGLIRTQHQNKSLQKIRENVTHGAPNPHILASTVDRARN